MEQTQVPTAEHNGHHGPEPRPEPTTAAPARDHGQPVVQVIELVKSFPVGGGKVTILKGISFEVSPGEFVSIVGPSGNGKSTLLNMLTGIDRPTSGEVIVTGQPVHKMSENQLAAWRGKHVGIVFQFFQMLPSLSLLQNVILPMDLAGKYSSR